MVVGDVQMDQMNEGSGDQGNLFHDVVVNLERQQWAIIFRRFVDDVLGPAAEFGPADVQ